jgi:hypothetical protein
MDIFKLMTRRLQCKHCGKTSAPQDAVSNWRTLGQRNGKPMFACDCGHGLYVGMFGSSQASVSEVEHQKQQMRSAGLHPDEKIPTPGDIEKAMREAPPGDLEFAVGDRIVNPMGATGTVKEIVQEGDKMLLRVLFDKGYGNVASVYPVEGKIRKIREHE